MRDPAAARRAVVLASPAAQGSNAHPDVVAQDPRHADPILVARGTPPLHDPARAAAIAAGKQPFTAGSATADSALVAALHATKTEATASQEHVRAAALAWDCERTEADALARCVAEAKHYLFAFTDRQPSLDYTDADAPSSTSSRPAQGNLMVAQLHLKAAGVQNIQTLVPVVLDPASSSYGRWRDLILLAL